MSVLVDIQKSFSNFTLDLAFEANSETLGLLGASGCGKSLTLRCIAGLEKPDKGKIVVAGKTFFDSERGINLTPQQRKTALLFQNYMLFPNLTVAENIAAGLPREMPKASKHEAVDEQLRRFGLSGFGKRYPIRLSGGQQQRVALARMLAAKPDILMLDEPFSALDSHLKSELEQELMDLFDEFDGSILYVSHDIDEAFRFCDRIAVIDDGSLRELSTTEQILNEPVSYATLRVSGVKNISAAKKIDEHLVEASDWGITLVSSKPVADDVAFVAVRASFIRAAKEGQALTFKQKLGSSAAAANCFDCTVERVINSRFEQTVILSFGPKTQKTIQWRFTRMDAAGTSKQGDEVLGDLQKHGHARIFIDPEVIHMVSN